MSVVVVIGIAVTVWFVVSFQSSILSNHLNIYTCLSSREM